MDDITVLGRDDAHDIFRRFQAQFDAPAYVRRAREVEDAYDALLRRCGQQRDEWLALVRSRLGALRALAGEWSVLRQWLGNDEVRSLAELHERLDPRLR